MPFFPASHYQRARWTAKFPRTFAERHVYRTHTASTRPVTYFRVYAANIPGRRIDTRSPSETIFISGLGDWRETRGGREKNMDDVDTAATCLSMSPVDMLSISLIYEITGNRRGDKTANASRFENDRNYGRIKYQARA